MNRSLLLSVAALVALYGCESTGQGFDPKQSMSTRTVIISVVDGVITVPQDPVNLFANNGAIRWVFDSDPSGFVFPQDGIKFVVNPTPPPASLGCKTFPDPATVFRNCMPMPPDKKEFQCNKTGPHVVDACFKYDVKVEPVGGGTPIVLDPWAKLK